MITALIQRTAHELEQGASYYLRLIGILRPLQPQLGEEQLESLRQAANMSWPPLVRMIRDLECAVIDLETTVGDDPRIALPLLRALSESWLLISSCENVAQLREVPIADRGELHSLASEPRIGMWLDRHASELAAQL